MNYQVLVVDDDELPLESGWVIVRASQGTTFLLVTKTRFGTSGWGVAWRAEAMLRDGLPAAV